MALLLLHIEKILKRDNMAEAGEEVKKIVSMVPVLLEFPAKNFTLILRVVLTYDVDADVLYISFERPQKATNTELTDKGILL